MTITKKEIRDRLGCKSRSTLGKWARSSGLLRDIPDFMTRRKFSFNEDLIIQTKIG